MLSLEQREIINPYHEFKELLAGISAKSQITSSPYDTAWLARLGEIDETLSQPALEWLRANQLADGSWGTPEVNYHHERVICTLAAMTALAQYGSSKDRTRWQRAQLVLETAPQGLLADPAGATIGFEMIVPTLLAEADALGIAYNADLLASLTRYRAAKLAALPRGMVDRAVSVAFSVEMVGADSLHLLDISNLQEANGSVAYSPSATAFFSKHVRPADPLALNYLHRVVHDDGGIPYCAPIATFERGWSLWNLAHTPLQDDAEFRAMCRPHLDFLESFWIPGQGIAAAAGLTLTDGDTTALIYDAMTSLGRTCDLDGVLNYEAEDHFICFPIEANPSISTNIHVLGALKRAGLEAHHPKVQKVIQFLKRVQTLQMFWFDKWHASPYYSTAHAIMVSVGYVDDLVENAAYWIVETQNRDGSWGYYVPTAEETAYCLQALLSLKRSGYPIPDAAIKRGEAWLWDHIDPPYTPLWIGKSLYCPIVVVRSAILSALIMALQT